MKIYPNSIQIIKLLSFIIVLFVFNSCVMQQNTSHKKSSYSSEYYDEGYDESDSGYFDDYDLDNEQDKD